MIPSHVSPIPPLAASSIIHGVSLVSSDSVTDRETSTCPSEASATRASAEMKSMQGSSLTRLPKPMRADRIMDTPASSVHLRRPRLFPPSQRTNIHSRCASAPSRSVPLLEHRRSAAFSVTMPHATLRSDAHRCRSHTRSSANIRAQLEQPSPEQMTSTSTGSSTKATAVGAQAASPWRIICEEASTPPYTCEHISDAGWLRCGGGQFSGRDGCACGSKAPAPLSSLPASAPATAGASLHDATQRLFFTDEEVSVTNADDPADTWASSHVSRRGTSSAPPTDSSTRLGPVADVVGTLLSGDIAPGALRGCTSSNSRAAPTAAVNVCPTTASSSSEIRFSSSPVCESTAPQCINTDTHGLPCDQMGCRESCPGGAGEGSGYVRLVTVPTCAVLQCGDMDVTAAALTGGVTPHRPGVRCIEFPGESVAHPRSPDTSLTGTRSTVRSCEVGDCPGVDSVLGGDVTGDNDVCERRSTVAFRRTPLKRERRVGDAATSQVQHTDAGPPVGATNSSSQSNLEAALKFHQQGVRQTYRSDRGTSSFTRDTLTAPHVSPPPTQLRCCSGVDGIALVATEQSTPLLSVNASHTSAGCALCNTTLGGNSYSTPVMRAASEAMVDAEATAQKGGCKGFLSSDATLLDSFRIDLAPCPSSIAPAFLLVPFLMASPMLTREGLGRRSWSHGARARAGAGVGNEDDSAVIRTPVPPPCPLAHRGWSLHGTPDAVHAAGENGGGRFSDGGVCHPARFRPLQGWASPSSSQSHAADDADTVATPRSCSPSFCSAFTGRLGCAAGVRQGHTFLPRKDASFYSCPSARRMHTVTVPPHQHSSSTHNSLVLQEAAIANTSQASHPNQPRSPPLHRGPVKPLPMFPSYAAAPDFSLIPTLARQYAGGDDGSDVSPAPAPAVGGVDGGGSRTPPELTTSAMRGAPRILTSAPSLGNLWQASRTPARHTDARVAAPWGTVSAATEPCHKSNSHVSCVDETPYFTNTRGSHVQSSVYSHSLMSPRLPLPASAVEDVLTSPPALADAPPLQSSRATADVAERCVAGELRRNTERLLDESYREGLLSTCSTPPRRPLLSPSTPRVSGFVSPSNGADAFYRRAMQNSARKNVLSSASFPRGSPLAAEARASPCLPWAPSQRMSPTALASVGGPGTDSGSRRTRTWVRRPSCTAATRAAASDSDIPLFWGEELELRGLQRISNMSSGSLMSPTGVMSAPIEAMYGVSQQAAPSTPHPKRGSCGVGRSVVGTRGAHGFSSMPLLPPPPLGALTGSGETSSTTPWHSSVSDPPAAMSCIPATRKAAHSRCISPRWSSLELSARKPSASRAAAMLGKTTPRREEIKMNALRGGEDQIQMTSASDSPANSTAAAEGAPPRMLSPQPGELKKTQFHCAFSSLRGCRRAQEDSVMIVDDLTVRLARCKPALSTTAASAEPSSVTQAEGSVGASRDTGVEGGVTERGAATSSIPKTEKVAAQHIADAPLEATLFCVGVFDGHCGDDVASFASNFFSEHLEYALQSYLRERGRDLGERGVLMGGARCSSDARGEVGQGPHPGHHEPFLSDVLEFQRVVSTSLVQALLHLDLTLYTLLTNPPKGRSALRCDAGSTATVAVFFKAPSATAPHHGGVRAVVGKSSNGVPLLSFGGSVAAPNSADSPTTRTPTVLDGAVRGRVGCGREATRSPMPATSVEGTYRLCIANLGDSRAIIGRLHTGDILLTTTDHRISSYPTEEARIHAAGGVVEMGRVGGTLDVTRGLGDYRHKVAPSQWWPSAALTASQEGVMKCEDDSTTSHMSSTEMEAVEGLAPLVSTLPCTDAASTGGTSVARTLRWHLRSMTPPQTPLSSCSDDSRFEDVDVQWDASSAQRPHQEVRLVSMKSSCDMHPPSGAEGETGGHVSPQKQPPQAVRGSNPSPVVFPKSPLTPRSAPLSASPETLTGNAVSNIADIYEWEVHRGEVLIVASDGVWDCMSSEEVLTLVCEALAEAQEHPNTSSVGAIRGDNVAAETSNGAGREVRELSGFDGVDAEVSSATGVTPSSRGGAIEGSPVRCASPCLGRSATGSRCCLGSAFCTPGGNEDVVCNDVPSAVGLPAGMINRAPSLFAVQTAARRLTEHVVHDLLGSDNTSAVVVVFH